MKDVIMEDVMNDQPFEYTEEMQMWYLERTSKHIQMVQNFIDIIGRKFPAHAYQLRLRGHSHDNSKFHSPERVPYIFLTWHYHCLENPTLDPDYEYPEGMKQLIQEATFHHIKNNQHHPDYWDENLTMNCLNSKDRDKPSGTLVDGTSMNELSLMEMCADWAAMGQEKGNSPKDWADKNVNIRWEFKPKQVDLIYRVLEVCNSMKEDNDG